MFRWSTRATGHNLAADTHVGASMGFWGRLFGRKTPAAAEVPPGPSKDWAVEPREALMRQVEALLRADPAVEKVARRTQDYGLDITRAGSDGTFFLDNLFADTRELPPEQRVQLIQRYLRALWQESPDSLHWEQARELLLPVLRASTFGMSLRKQAEADREMVGRRTLPFLRELLVMDLPESAMFVQRRHLETWGVTEEEAFTAAHANLVRLPDEGVELYDEEHGPLWTVETRDTYETSRLLRPGFLASFAGRVEGRPVAVLPERSTLLIGGDARPELVARLSESAEREYAAASRCLTPALYTVDDAGRVVPYVHPGQDALANRVRLAHVRLALAEYSAQKEALDALHAEQEVDLFVASYSATARKRDEFPISWCVWSHDVDALLPEADMVAVRPAAEGEEFFTVPWREVQRIAGGCLTPVPELWPPRYRTTQTPSPEMVEQLRAAQVSFEDFQAP
ncbi:DUF1444 family protein [Myxococcus sp. AM010]|nr:DUF1444 family protein [Myxococcus sp. AM010]